MSDLDLDSLVHTAEGRLVEEVLQRRRLPLMIALQDKGEWVVWYPQTVIANLDGNPELAHEWIRMLGEHIEQLRKRYPVQ